MNANNVISIHGRLTRDPELKTSQTGSEYCKFSVAVDRFDGKEKKTDFFNCTAFGKTGVAINQYMTKGREICVVGSMESNTVEKDGNKSTYWGIRVDGFGFCGGKGSDKGQTDSASGMTVVNPDDDPFA